jgi:hypothetical protein
MGQRLWQILWRLVANVAIIVIADWLLDFLAAQLGIITPANATTATNLFGFLLGGLVVAACVFSIGWVWLPYIRPQAQTAERS